MNLSKTKSMLSNVLSDAYTGLDEFKEAKKMRYYEATKLEINSKRLFMTSESRSRELKLKKMYALIKDLSHPYVLTPHHLFELKKNRCSIEFDLIPENFEDFVNKKLSEITLVQFVLKLCEGVSYIHSKGIIHCDINPKNILIKDNNPIITNFLNSGKKLPNGISKIKFGNSIFQAPEILRRETINEKCDVWAVGVILVHCVEEATYTEFTKKEYRNGVEDGKFLVKFKEGTLYKDLFELIFVMEKEKRITLECFTMALSSILKKLTPPPPPPPSTS